MNIKENARYIINNYLDDMLIFVGAFLLNISVYLFNFVIGIGFTGITLIVFGILFTIKPIEIKPKIERR